MIADNKKKIELAITGIGVIALIFLVIGHVSNRRDRPRPVPTDKPYSTSEAGFEVTNNEQRTTNDERWGRDPFLLDTSNVKEQGTEDLVLNGIVSDKTNPYAIINNDVVKLGDKVNGMTIIEINENNVVLEQDGQRHTLELNLY